jgi:hypothetical protein
VEENGGSGKSFLLAARSSAAGKNKTSKIVVNPLKLISITESIQPD